MPHGPECKAIFCLGLLALTVAINSGCGLIASQASAAAADAPAISFERPHIGSEQAVYAASQAQEPELELATQAGPSRSASRRGEPALFVLAPASDWEFFTGGRTFERLQADPRWPSFSAFYRFQRGGRYLYEYEAISIGDTIALARGPAELRGHRFELEIGAQAGVFAIYHPHSPSQDLINSDYVGGAYLAARQGRWSAMFRVWHLSGHVGDEFLLRPELYVGAARDNFKYEAIQLLGSYDFRGGLRAYGGPAVLLLTAPDSYSNYQFNAGLEYHAPIRFWRIARPVAAVDLRMLAEFDLVPDVSVRTGLSFDRGRRTPAFQAMLEGYTGRDPNGQFYIDKVAYFGAGFMFNF